MAAHGRFAHSVLAPINVIALVTGIAVANGTIPLPTQPQGVTASAYVPAPEQVLPAQRVGPTVIPTRLTVRHAPVAKRTRVREGVATRPASYTAKRFRRTQLSFAAEVQRQVLRIPLYRPGLTRWVVQRDLPVYAKTRLREHTVYLSPRIPRRLIYSVVAHEWGHVISTHAYGGDLRVSQEAFRDWFGGDSLRTGIERAADCIAILLGATWVHYTPCSNERWRLGARYLAKGVRLPEQ
jgi:hypothetical protein